MAGRGPDPWGRLTAAAEARELWLADGAGERCAEACTELMEELDRRARAIRELSSVGGFGGFVSAQQLQAGFQNKALEAHRRILEFRAVVERMRETFYAADKAYRAIEADTERAITRAAAASDAPVDGETDRPGSSAGSGFGR